MEFVTDAWKFIILSIMLVAYTLYVAGPMKDGPWTRPDKRIARQARRVLKMMRKALPALSIGAVFGLAAAGSDASAVAFAGLLVWVGGSMFVDTMNRPFGKRPRIAAILIGLSISAMGLGAVL